MQFRELLFNQIKQKSHPKFQIELLKFDNVIEGQSCSQRIGIT